MFIICLKVANITTNRRVGVERVISKNSSDRFECLAVTGSLLNKHLSKSCSLRSKHTKHTFSCVTRSA